MTGPLSRQPSERCFLQDTNSTSGTAFKTLSLPVSMTTWEWAASVMSPCVYRWHHGLVITVGFTL